MPVAIVPVQTGQQQRRVPGDQPRQRQEEDPSNPPQVRHRKRQRGIRRCRAIIQGCYQSEAS